ncbi:MAG: hypothetical protein ACYTGL_07670 [Planctomycetota bacterium]|jgi:hypothetical protein
MNTVNTLLYHIAAFAAATILILISDTIRDAIRVSCARGNGRFRRR